MADQLAELFVKFSVQGDDFKAGLKDMGMEISETEKKTGGLESAFNKLGAQIIAAFGVYKLYGYAKDILEVGIAMDSLKTSMEVSTGSAMAGAAAMAFLKTESERLGLVFLDNVKSFQSLAAAASTSTLTMDQTKQIWTGVATAGAALKLSTDQMNGAFMALQQMISKGTVSAEEMRQQLGERLPGAFALAAQAMNMTTQEFGKAMEQGKVYADDFLPKLAAKLIEVYGDAAVNAAGSAQAAINRFHNASDALKIQMANDLLPTFTKLTVAATDFLKVMAPPKETDVLAQMLESINRQLAFSETSLGKAAEAWEKFWGRGDVDRLQELKSQLEFRIKMINDHTQEADKSWRWEADAAATRRTEKEAAEEASFQKKLDLIAIELDAQKDLDAELIALDKKLWAEKQAIVTASSAEIVSSIRGMSDQSTIEVEDFADSFVSDIRAMSATTQTLVGSMATDVVGDIRGIGTEATTATEDMAEAMVSDIRSAGTGYTEFFNGVKKGLDDILNQEMTWSAAGTKVIKDLATASRNTMSDVFFNAMSGDLKSFGDYWNSFWNGMKRTTADLLSSMATDSLSKMVKGFFEPTQSAASNWSGSISSLMQSAFAGIGNTLSGYGGSLVNSIMSLGSSISNALGGLFSFHEGNWLVPGEMLAILQEGEMVIPAALAKLVRPLLSALAGVPGNFGSIIDSISGVFSNFDSNIVGASLEKFAGYTSTDYGGILGDMNWLDSGSVSSLGGMIQSDVASNYFDFPTPGLFDAVSEYLPFLGALAKVLQGDIIGGLASGIGTWAGGPPGAIFGSIVAGMIKALMDHGPKTYSLGELTPYMPGPWQDGTGLKLGTVIPRGDWYQDIANSYTYGLDAMAKDYNSRTLALLKYMPNADAVMGRLSSYPYWKLATNQQHQLQSAGSDIPSIVQSIGTAWWDAWGAASSGGAFKNPYMPKFMDPTDVGFGPGVLPPGALGWKMDELGTGHAYDETGKWAIEMPVSDAGGYGGYSKGTGLGGLPRTGSYYGHQGEIVLNPSESAMVRSGGGGSGGTTHIHVEIDGKEMMRLLVKNADKSPEWSASIGRIIRRYAH